MMHTFTGDLTDLYRAFEGTRANDPEWVMPTVTVDAIVDAAEQQGISYTAPPSGGNHLIGCPVVVDDTMDPGTFRIRERVYIVEGVL